jgi:hypothetical protein
MKKEAVEDSPEDFEFFITVGDNMYPLVEKFPTDAEVHKMMDLFNTRENIKDIPIYPVRGNHDCYFDDQDLELDLAQNFSNWQFEDDYYLKEFEIGPGGEKLSLLMVDSCYLICETVGKVKDPLYHKHMDLETKYLWANRCENETFRAKGNKMMGWLEDTLAEQDADQKIQWKASVMHHPTYGIVDADWDPII